jgi:hypothetical protein
MKGVPHCQMLIASYEHPANARLFLPESIYVCCYICSLKVNNYLSRPNFYFQYIRQDIFVCFPGK